MNFDFLKDLPILLQIGLIIVIVLVIVLVFLLLWFKGFRIGKGDLKLSLGNTIDEKIKKLKEEWDTRRAAETHDKELQNGLFRESCAIDDKLKADMRRIVRSMNDSILSVFGQYVKCEFPALHLESMIKSELLQRIDENHMRSRLQSREREGYLLEIIVDIRKEYEVFLKSVDATTCGEKYAAWDQIEAGVSIILFNWAEKTRAEIQKRTREKIDFYTASREKFLLDDYKKTAVDEPIEKNKGYLADLEGMAS